MALAGTVLGIRDKEGRKVGAGWPVDLECGAHPLVSCHLESADTLLSPSWFDARVNMNNVNCEEERSNIVQNSD